MVHLFLHERDWRRPSSHTVQLWLAPGPGCDRKAARGLPRGKSPPPRQDEVREGLGDDGQRVVRALLDGAASAHAEIYASARSP
jgi:hypothetical protein